MHMIVLHFLFKMSGSQAQNTPMTNEESNALLCT